MNFFCLFVCWGGGTIYRACLEKEGGAVSFPWYIPPPPFNIEKETERDRQTDRQTEGQTDIQTDKQTDRQTDRQRKAVYEAW